jgi:hypothetical protein
VSEKEGLDTRGLDLLLRVLRAPAPVARVGILQDQPRSENKSTISYGDLKNFTKPRRAGRRLSNAEIGIIHEFGDTTHPQRSFLRVPIASRLQKELEASGAFDKRVVEQMWVERSFLPFVKKMAIIGEKIVLDAFATGGFGKWPKWKGSYTSATGNILVDSTQLRNSISSTVVEAH